MGRGRSSKRGKAATQVEERQRPFAARMIGLLAQSAKGCERTLLRLHLNCTRNTPSWQSCKAISSPYPTRTGAEARRPPTSDWRPFFLHVRELLTSFLCPRQGTKVDFRRTLCYAGC